MGQYQSPTLGAHTHAHEHHIRNFGRFPVSQFDDSLGGVDLKCTQWVHFRSTQPKLYFPKIMEFSQNFEYGVQTGYQHMYKIHVHGCSKLLGIHDAYVKSSAKKVKTQ